MLLLLLQCWCLTILGSKWCSVSLNVDDSCSRNIHWVIRCHACYSLCRLNACKLPIECEHSSYSHRQTHTHTHRFTFSAYNMCKSLFAFIWDWRWVQAHQRKSVINIKQQPTFHMISSSESYLRVQSEYNTCAFSVYLYVWRCVLLANCIYMWRRKKENEQKKTLFYFERMVDECIMEKDRKMLATTSFADREREEKEKRDRKRKKKYQVLVWI